MNAPTCNSGCYPNDCECELDCDVAPDADRVIRAPLPAEADPAFRARVLRWSAAAGLSCWLALAALLRLFGARSLY